MRRAAALLLALAAAGGGHGLQAAEAAAPREVVERALKARNRHDADAAAALFAADAEVWTLGAEKPEASGREAVRQFFLAQFRENPKVRSSLVKAIELGPWVAVQERTTPEPGEAPRDALAVFEVVGGSIRRFWSMKARESDEGPAGGEGPVALQIERLNERDLPRLLATYDEGATIWLLATGTRLAAGEDALREQFEKAFEAEPHPRVEVPQRMAAGSWVVYRERTVPAPPGRGEAIVIYEVRDNLIRRVWIAS